MSLLIHLLLSYLAFLPSVSILFIWEPFLPEEVNLCKLFLIQFLKSSFSLSSQMSSPSILHTSCMPWLLSSLFACSSSFSAYLRSPSRSSLFCSAFSSLSSFSLLYPSLIISSPPLSPSLKEFRHPMYKLLSSCLSPLKLLSFFCSLLCTYS